MAAILCCAWSVMLCHWISHFVPKPWQMLPYLAMMLPYLAILLLNMRAIKVRFRRSESAGLNFLLAGSLTLTALFMTLQESYLTFRDRDGLSATSGEICFVVLATLASVAFCSAEEEKPRYFRAGLFGLIGYLIVMPAVIWIG